MIGKRTREKQMQTLKGNNLHGQMWQKLANQNAAEECWLWLKKWRMAANTEATLMAVVDGVIWTRAIRRP